MNPLFLIVIFASSIALAILLFAIYETHLRFSIHYLRFNWMSFKIKRISKRKGLDEETKAKLRTVAAGLKILANDKEAA